MHHVTSWCQLGHKHSAIEVLLNQCSISPYSYVAMLSSVTRCAMLFSFKGCRNAHLRRQTAIRMPLWEDRKIIIDMHTCLTIAATARLGFSPRHLTKAIVQCIKSRGYAAFYLCEMPYARFFHALPHLLGCSVSGCEIASLAGNVSSGGLKRQQT